MSLPTVCLRCHDGNYEASTARDDRRAGSVGAFSGRDARRDLRSQERDPEGREAPGAGAEKEKRTTGGAFVNAERNYDGLLTAGSVVFGFGVLVCIVSVIAAFYWVSVERVEAAIIAVGCGVGLLINGVIVRGLIRLAVNVANDLAEMAQPRTITESLAPVGSEPAQSDAGLQSAMRTCSFCGVQTLGDEEKCARCGQPLSWIRGG